MVELNLNVRQGEEIEEERERQARVAVLEAEAPKTYDPAVVTGLVAGFSLIPPFTFFGGLVGNAYVGKYGRWLCCELLVVAMVLMFIGSLGSLEHSDQATPLWPCAVIAVLVHLYVLVAPINDAANSQTAYNNYVADILRAEDEAAAEQAAAQREQEESEDAAAVDRYIDRAYTLYGRVEETRNLLEKETADIVRVALIHRLTQQEAELERFLLVDLEGRVTEIDLKNGT